MYLEHPENEDELSEDSPLSRNSLPRLIRESLESIEFEFRQNLLVRKVQPFWDVRCLPGYCVRDHDFQADQTCPYAIFLTTSVIPFRDVTVDLANSDSKRREDRDLAKQRFEAMVNKNFKNHFQTIDWDLAPTADDLRKLTTKLLQLWNQPFLGIPFGTESSNLLRKYLFHVPYMCKAGSLGFWNWLLACLHGSTDVVIFLNSGAVFDVVLTVMINQHWTKPTVILDRSTDNSEELKVKLAELNLSRAQVDEEILVCNGLLPLRAIRPLQLTIHHVFAEYRCLSKASYPVQCIDEPNRPRTVTYALTFQCLKQYATFFRSRLLCLTDTSLGKVLFL